LRGGALFVGLCMMSTVVSVGADRPMLYNTADDYKKETRMGDVGWTYAISQMRIWYTFIALE
jgi:hypothetical protein